ncbi:ASF1 [Sanghuangporus sanghuang]
MSIVTIKNVEFLNNPARFTDPYRFRVLFECIAPLPDDLEWRLIYVSSPGNEELDQELDSCLVGPVPVGTNSFDFESPAPDWRKIPREDLLGVAALILTGSYNDQEFVRVGYYQNTEYDTEELRENPPAQVMVERLTRDVNMKPRVTRFQIKWDVSPMQNTHVAVGAAQSAAVPSANDLVDDEPMDVQPTVPLAPKTSLGRYRVLSPLAGIRVSPIQLGATSIEDKWEKLGTGAMDKESSFKLLDAYYDAGGNFIDLRDGTSEEFIGEWMEKKGIRDQMVIATKYTTYSKRDADDIPIKVNYTSNNTKSLMLSVEASQEAEDIVHRHSLRSLAGLADEHRGNTPARIVSYANAYAKAHEKTQFVIYQGAWKIMERSFEREIIPMARTLGLALAPFNVLSSGKLCTDAEEERRKATGEKGCIMLAPNRERSEDEEKMSAALEKVAKDVGRGRKVEHLMANINALKISLSDEQVKYLESILPFDPDFPINFFGDGTAHRPSTLFDTPNA